MIPIVGNFILFQVGWLVCVLSGAALQPAVGVLIAALIIGFHVWRAEYPRQEMWLIGLAMIIGAAWDSLLVALDWLEYPAGMLLPNMAPYWIVVMWGLFATTLNLSLRWLRKDMRLAAVLGGIAGPLAYLGGAGLGAVEFVDGFNATIALAAGWAVFTPLLLALAKRFDGYPTLAAGRA